MSAAEPLPLDGTSPSDRRWWVNPADVFLERFYTDPATSYIEGLYERPWWHALALCRGEMDDGHALWFSSDARERAQARAICAGCPVRDECADAGQDQRGIWGGR